jgi:hypothetical protein
VLRWNLRYTQKSIPVTVKEERVFILPYLRYIILECPYLLGIFEKYSILKGIFRVWSAQFAYCY